MCVVCEHPLFLRAILNKATSQKLNFKKMKLLFKKYEQFENKYGNEETQNFRKKLLQEYASQFDNSK